MCRRNFRRFGLTTPYIAPTDPTYGVTSYLYDALGRLTNTTEQDGSTLPSSYSGSVATSSDEIGNPWQRTTDALGRLINVTEPGGQQTTYGYDALGNLLNVNQLGVSGETPRVRTFTYDSLSRLLTATNPETGTVCYGQWSAGSCVNGYDSNGNLINKTDARNITTSYSYDALNRMTLKQAPGLYYVYSYDTSTNGIGRMGWASNAVNADEVYSYDAMGRLNWQAAWTPSNPNNSSLIVTANYDLAGNMTDLTYPDGRHIQQAWDSAGHLCNVMDAVTGAADCNTNSTFRYFSSPSYFPNGSLAQAFFGNGITENFSLNNRWQPTEISVQNSGGVSYMDKQYCYGTDTPLCPNSQPTNNNGNILAALNAVDSSRNQYYSYDNLNRISGFSNDSQSMSQTFSIDSFGNLNVNGGTLQSNLGFDSNNRISGYGYDAAGNVTQAPSPFGGTQQYNYDSEGKLLSMGDPASPSASYTYDANGARVRKDASGSWTEYIAFEGVPLAEKSSNGGWSDYIFAHGQKIARVESVPSVALHFYSTDHLGTTTVVTDGQGGLENDSDYYPFGVENAVTTADSNHFKFAGKERDPESGNDYFGARYYASSMGRFMSPDWNETPVAIPYANIENPQSLNLYAYGGNNPLTTVDLDGHCWVIFRFSQHVCNAVDGFGWVDDDQRDDMVADERQQLITHRVVAVDKNGNKQPIDWSKADQKTVHGVFGAVAAAAIKPINLPAWKTIDIDMDHIVSGHTAGGSRVGPGSEKDLFPEDWDETKIEKSIREAYRNGKKISSTTDGRVMIEGTANGRTIQMYVNTTTRTVETAWPK